MCDFLGASRRRRHQVLSFPLDFLSEKKNVQWQISYSKSTLLLTEKTPRTANSVMRISNSWATLFVGLTFQATEKVVLRQVFCLSNGEWDRQMPQGSSSSDQSRPEKKNRTKDVSQTRAFILFLTILLSYIMWREKNNLWAPTLRTAITAVISLSPISSCKVLSAASDSTDSSRSCGSLLSLVA